MATLDTILYEVQNMGAYQNNQQAEKKGSKSRGTVKNSDRLQAFASGGEEGHADWATCDAALLQAVVTGITALGGAVTFGLSRDMGAHSLTLLLDSKRKTMWYNGGADLDDELQAVIGTLSQMD